MNKFDRIKLAISGEKQGSIPFSFWTHLPEIDRSPKEVAQATYDLFKQYDLDFIKTMNNGMYAVEDYNTEIDFSEVAKVIKTLINAYEDWSNLPLLELETASALQRELDHLEHLLNLVDGEAPVIMTVFSPLTTAAKLAKGQLINHLNQDEHGYIHQALDKIAEATAALAHKAIELGAAGVYFASQMSSYDQVSEEIYADYGVPYDL